MSETIDGIEVDALLFTVHRRPFTYGSPNFERARGCSFLGGGMFAADCYGLITPAGITDVFLPQVSFFPRGSQESAHCRSRLW